MKKGLKFYFNIFIIIVTIITNLYATYLVVDNYDNPNWDAMGDCIKGLFILVVIGFPLSITSIVIIIKYIIKKVKNRKK